MDAIILAPAGNTLAPALAELKRMGFSVSREKDSTGNLAYRAVRASTVLSGDDVLQLLALATLVERRGTAASTPSDDEINDLLRLDAV